MKKLAVLGGKPVGKIHYPSWPVFDEREINAVTGVVKSGSWGIGGPKVKEFEEEFARFCKVKHGITSVNGTVTLRLALEALGVGPGDEVIVPGISFQATAAAVLDVNAVPILVDIDPDTYTINPKAIESAVTAKTRCIIPVHLYGRVADMDAIMAIADKYKLFVVEDCAHQHGSEWKGKPVGSIGNIGSFSLQAYKILNAGEGGILTTDDDRLSDLLRSLKNIGMACWEGAPTMQSGNYRMTEFQAAILLAQMQRLEEQNALREKNVLYMESNITDIEGIKPLYRSPNITKQSYFRWTLKYISEAWEGIPKNKFLEALSAELENSFQCSVPYEPLNKCIFYKPHTKNTHKLSEEYWKAIDPGRFDLPVSKKAFEDEAFCFYHSILLTDRAGCDTIIEALRKLRADIAELAEFAQK